MEENRENVDSCQGIHNVFVDVSEGGIGVEHADTTAKWVKQCLSKLRLTSRKPNRKFKVRREVLKERLFYSWTSLAKLRKACLILRGYDPEMRNIDKSPFHQNETGGVDSNTIVMQGAPTVPLIEDHCATRARISLNSVTDSCKERLERELPGFELMFKAGGFEKQKRLKLYVATHYSDLPFKVSVVTSTSGSYKEQDILAFLDQWLEPWDDLTRRWEIILMGAHQPCLTGNIARF